MAGPGSDLIGDAELQEVIDVMKSGHLSRYGNLQDQNFRHKVYSFEKSFASYCGAEFALATSSGTASILIALLALNLKPGDEVIVPTYTFVATYSAIIFAGLVPVLTEIDESLNMDPEKIESRITPRSKVIMPVHMLGNPCDMAAIQTVAKRHGLFVVEDCCQSVGGSFRGKKVGTLGEIGAYSLNINKTITTGDGGVVVTNEKKLYQRCFAIHDQGHSPFRGEVEIGKRSILGLNFRMTELSGAVALAQLRKIKTIIAELKKKKNKFKDLIADVKELKFRKLNDPAGECGTLCTVIFEQKEKAEKVAKILGTKTVDRSGWHVYANMEHINNYLKEIGQPFGKGAYPITDDILSRAINISIGVVDDGLGSGFGININSTEKEIADAAEKFCQACRQAS